MTDNSEAPTFFKVFLSFALAMILRIVPFHAPLSIFNPDWVALMLLVWTLSVPPRIGVLRAWMLGLIVDALTGRSLGQHALAYGLMVYLSLLGKAGIVVLRKPVQVLWILGLLLAGQLIILWTEQQALPAEMALSYWYPSLIGALIWPLLVWLFKSHDSRSLT